jgi:peptidoglycan/LPS O-acetylase OafA/YrhL
MGAFRFFLAICVVMAHAASISPLINLNYLNSSTAIIIFYIISGYYMHMILSEKYTFENLGKFRTAKFYFSRYIRIFPTYLICIIATFIYIYYINNDFSANIVNPKIEINKILNLPNNLENIVFKTWYFFASLFILLQDLSLNLVITNDIARFSLERSIGSIYVASAFLIPQSWSIGSELFFYCLAPFIIKLKTRKIFMAIIFLLVLVIFSIKLGPPGDIYFRASLFTMPYFLIGCLLYRFKDKLNIYSSKENYSIKILTAYLFVISITLFFPWNGLLYTFPIVIICSIFIPSLYFISKDNLIDRWLGELSYPIYVYHMLFYFIASNNWKNFDWIAINWGFNSHQLITLITLLSTLIASIITVAIATKIIDPWRYKTINIYAYKQ